MWNILKFQEFFELISFNEDDNSILEWVFKVNSVDDYFKLKEETLHRLVERSMYLWLYPNHKLTITQVKDLLKPYFEDEDKAEWLGSKVGQLLQECREVRESYVNEQKNLQALANKKN